MSFCKTLAQRLLNVTRILKKSSNTSETTSFSSEPKIFRRILQKRPMFEAATSPDYPSLPIGNKVIGELRGVNRDEIKLDGLVVTPRPPSDSITIENVRKLLRQWQLEELKCRLRRIPRKSVTYREFVEMCRDWVGCWSREEALGIVRTLDESGVVIVLGNVVFLRPEELRDSRWQKQLQPRYLYLCPNQVTQEGENSKRWRKRRLRLTKRPNRLSRENYRSASAFSPSKPSGS